MKVRTFIGKAQNDDLTAGDVKTLLTGGLSAEETDDLFAAACQVREKNFGVDIFTYGFVYLSTYCRNDCQFCHYRNSREIHRYRKSVSEVLEAATHLAEDGIHLIDLTLGEDPYFLTEKGFEEFCRMIKLVKSETGLPVMISPGLITQDMMIAAHNAGADWYACYQETHNPALFAAWRKDQDYEKRLRSKIEAAEVGLLTEEGILVGAGAGIDDLAHSVLSMGELNASQVRAMAYVPNPGSLPPAPNEDPLLMEKIMIAVLRLAYPQVLIPATLDVEGLAGLKSRIMAGANVVTSIVPAGQGLAGVAQAEFDIENENRSSQKVADVLNEMGLKIAGPGVYKNWLTRQKTLQGLVDHEHFNCRRRATGG